MALAPPVMDSEAVKRRHLAYLYVAFAVFWLGAAVFDYRLRHVLLAAGFGLVALLTAKGRIPLLKHGVRED